MINNTHIKPYTQLLISTLFHDDVIKWKYFPRYWSSVCLVNSPNKGQWREALMFSLICAWTNVWANRRDAGELRRHRHHCDVTVMLNKTLHVTGAGVSMWLHLMYVCYGVNVMTHCSKITMHAFWQSIAFFALTIVFYGVLYKKISKNCLITAAKYRTVWIFE